MKCKNCGHEIDILWEGIPNHRNYKARATIYEHKKGPPKKPVSYCFCGCGKPEPQSPNTSTIPRDSK